MKRRLLSFLPSWPRAFFRLFRLPSSLPLVALLAIGAFGQGRPDLLWMTSGARHGKISYSPDGLFLAAGGGIWSVTNRMLVRTLDHSAITYRPHSTVWSADGTLVANGREREITLWRFPDGVRARTFVVTNGLVTDVAFSADGSLLAAGTLYGKFDPGDGWEYEWDEPGEVWVWRTSDGVLLHRMLGHEEEVKAIAFSPATDLLASASRDRSVILWRASTGDRVRTLTGFGDQTTAVQFSPDGQTIAVSTEISQIKVFETDTGDLLHSLSVASNNETYPVAFSPDGTLLASNGDADTINVWQLSDGELVRVFAGHTGEITSIAFSPDGKTLASNSEDMTIRFWDMAARKEAGKLPGHVDPVQTVAVSPDGAYLASGAYDGVRIWNARNGDVITNLSGDALFIDSLAFSSNGTILAAGTGDGTIALWRSSDWSLLRRLSGHQSGVFSVAFSPDGSLLASGSHDLSTKLWRVSDGANLWTTYPGAQALAFSPDGTTPAAAHYGVHLLKVDTGEVHRTFRTNHFSFSASLAFTPDGKSLLEAGRAEPNVRLWRVSDGRLLRTFGGHEGGVWGLSLAPDGDSFLTGANDLKLWRLSDGALLKQWDQETYWVSAIAFAPDGQSFAYGRSDHVVAVARTPLWIKSLERQAGVDVIRWQGGRGRYQVQRTTNLATGVWQDIGSPTTALAATVETLGTQTFYRVRNADE